MITGRNNTIKWLETLTEQNFPYWTIYHRNKTDSGNFVLKSSQAEDLTMTDSIHDLRKKLDILGYGQYMIRAQAKPGPAVKGASNEDFEITSMEAQPLAAIGSVAVQPSMAGYVTKEEASEMAQKMFQELMLKKEVEDLKKQNADLVKEKKEWEKESNDGTTRIINMVAGIVEPMLKQPAMAQVGTLGVVPALSPSATETTENEFSTEQQEQLGERLHKVLTDCEEIFGEPAIPFLEKLMAKVKAQPYLVTLVKGALL